MLVLAKEFRKWVLDVLEKTYDVYIPEPPAVQPVIEFQQSPEAMKAVGGMIKKCCKTAVREVFTSDNETAMSALNIIINRIAEERCRGMYQAWREAAIRNIQNAL